MSQPTTAALPSSSELASLIAAAGSHHSAPAAVPALHAMIEACEAARALYRELMTARDDEPSPFQLAHLLFSVNYPYESPPDVTVLHWLIAQSPEARELFERLEAMADDAGLSPLKPGEAYRVIVSHSQLDQLLAADDWQDPDDVLDPTHYLGIHPAEMLAICNTRLARARGPEARQLAAVRAKLVRSALIDRLQSHNPPQLEQLVNWLREIDCVDAAVESLQDLARLLRSREAGT